MSFGGADGADEVAGLGLLVVGVPVGDPGDVVGGEVGVDAGGELVGGEAGVGVAGEGVADAVQGEGAVAGELVAVGPGEVFDVRVEGPWAPAPPG